VRALLKNMPIKSARKALYPVELVSLLAEFGA
jgi:hypothetical protein